MRDGDMVRTNSLGPFLVLMFAHCLKCFPVAWQHLETFLMLENPLKWDRTTVLGLTSCCG